MSAFFATLVVNTDNQDLTVDSTPTALTSGTYYGWHPTPASSLCDHLAAVITASASSATVTASVSSDGILTLTGTASFEVTNFDAYDMFGFASNSLTGASSYVATSRLQGSWIPGREPSAALAPPSEGYASIDLAAQDESADGTVYTTEFGERRRQALTFPWVSKAKAWRTTRSGAVDWARLCSDGRAMVYIPEWTGSGSYTTYWIYRRDMKAQPEVTPKVQGETAPTDLWWTVELQLRAAQ